MRVLFVHLVRRQANSLTGKGLRSFHFVSIPAETFNLVSPVRRLCDDRAVRQRLKEIAETRVRYGFDAFKCCCDVKVGATITNELTAFTRKKG